MKLKQLVFVIFTSAAMLFLSTGANAGQAHVIKVSSIGGMPMVDLDAIYAKPGDKVVFVGDGVDSFEILFPGAKPIPNASSRNTTNGAIIVKIEDAAADGTYKYDVRIGDTVLDPYIIISK